MFFSVLHKTVSTVCILMAPGAKESYTAHSELKQTTNRIMRKVFFLQMHDILHKTLPTMITFQTSQTGTRDCNNWAIVFILRWSAHHSFINRVVAWPMKNKISKYSRDSHYSYKCQSTTLRNKVLAGKGLIS